MFKIKFFPAVVFISHLLICPLAVWAHESGDFSHPNGCPSHLLDDSSHRVLFENFVDSVRWASASPEELLKLRQFAFQLPLLTVYDAFQARLNPVDKFWMISPDTLFGWMANKLSRLSQPNSPLLIFSQIVLDHPADYFERQQVLWHALEVGDAHRFQLLDEVMGISGHHLELEERTDASRRFDRRQNRKSLGIGHAHSFWFSDYRIVEAAARDMQFERLIVDLGSGTGRLGLLIGFLYPRLQFIGLEIDRDRTAVAQAAAQRWGIQDRVKFVQQDLTDLGAKIPTADAYFVFGPTNSLETNYLVIQRLRKELGSGHRYSVYTHHPQTKEILQGSKSTRKSRQVYATLWQFDLKND